MPNFAYVRHATPCPNCGETLRDLVSGSEYIAFQWGFCPSLAPMPEYTYALGDAIKWRTCKDGSIIPWASFTWWTYSHKRFGQNLGDPAEQHIVAIDYHFARQPRPHPCQACGYEYEGYGTRIKDGRIVEVFVFETGMYDKEIGLYRIGADGSKIVVPEWLNRPTPPANCA